MSIIYVQFVPWDKIYSFSSNSLTLKEGDQVIVETELGKELAKVVAIDKDLEDTELKPVLRKANKDDLEQIVDEKKKKETLKICRKLIKKHDLPMKLVDVHFSFEGNRINFAFIADNRVDFRNLVRDLASTLNANIRLTQIGTRDEARIMGDCGPCGRPLCCRNNIKEFSSITSEMAEVQQVVHRGSDRISGMCGRLMCCLSYEYEGYKEMAGKLPPIGTKVRVDGSRGVVIAHHILKQMVDVRLISDKKDEDGVIITVDINRHKKNNKK